MGILGWVKSKFRREPEKPIYSFVWLLGEPRQIDLDIVKRTAERELGVEFPGVTDGMPQFIVGELPTFFVKLGQHMLMVNCFPTPYVQDQVKAANDASELRMKNILLEHRAWLSVDVAGEAEGAFLEEGYRLAGKLAAGLADNRCLGLFATQTNHLIPYSDELLDQLRSDDPLGSISWALAPVITVSESDPRMIAAVDEAKRRWLEFVREYENPKPNQEFFAVKLPITDGRQTEYMWVSIKRIEGDTIVGELGNEPVNLRFFKLGDTVRGKLEDLNDWTYFEDGEMKGGFTLAVLQAASKR